MNNARLHVRPCISLLCKLKPRPHQQQCRSNIRLCRKNRSTCSIRQCFFDVVAGVDGAYGLLSVAQQSFEICVVRSLCYRLTALFSAVAACVTNCIVYLLRYTSHEPDDVMARLKIQDWKMTLIKNTVLLKVKTQC